ncbi:hypothetical protein ACHAWF_014910 [Thalassiosira exigua]
MIEEDESRDEDRDHDHHSLVSAVTGATFVRTPVTRKGPGGRTPRSDRSNAHQGATGGPGSVRSGGGHRTPRGGGPSPSASSSAAGATPLTTSQLLHRPSLAMRESLDKLGTDATRALEEIWDRVGVEPDDRARQLDGLLEQVAELFDAKVRGEEGMMHQYVEEIEGMRREWEESRRALRLDGEEDPLARMRRDPSARDISDESGETRVGGQNLTWEYEVLSSKLESLRVVKEAAVADLSESRDRIREAHAALRGITVEEAAALDELRPYEDVELDLTEERREAMRAKAEECEEDVAVRTRAIVSTILDCQAAMRELELVPPCEEDARVGRCEDDAKIMSSLKPVGDESARDDVRAGRPHRGQSDRYALASLFETPTCIGIGASALDRLTERIAELSGEKHRRRVELSKMGGTIQELWKTLRITTEEQEAFTRSIGGLGIDTIRKGEAEIARLVELKGVMIGKLVREQRSTIRELWDETNASAAERASFDAFYRIEDDDQLTSEVLGRHEEYAATLRAKLERMWPILELIAKREAIIEERIELEFLQKDPDRLKGRGASKQLAKEEKMNRRVRKELPKITAHLEKTLRQWYAENKPSAEDDEEGDELELELGHFMYKGTPYLRTMQCQEEEWRTRKERGEQERHRKREEERAAASSANAVFGYTTYTKLPGKKWHPTPSSNGAADTGRRPHSANTERSGSNMRSGSNTRSGSNMRSGGSRPASSNAGAPRSGSNLRFGGRGPLGDVSSSRQNTSRPPSRPRAREGKAGPGEDRGKVPAASGRGYRPDSAPRMRF